jgi:antitoxin Phd
MDGSMTRASWPLFDAKNRLSTVIDAACKGEAQLVTRHNQPVAVVLSVEEYTRLKALEDRTVPSFADQLLALPQDDETFPRIELEPRPIGF